MEDSIFWRNWRTGTSFSLLSYSGPPPPLESTRKILCHDICYLFFQKKLKCLHQLDSKNNGQVLFRYWNCLLSSVTRHGNDCHGLKLEKIGPISAPFSAPSHEPLPVPTIWTPGTGYSSLEISSYSIYLRGNSFHCKELMKLPNSNKSESINVLNIWRIENVTVKKTFAGTDQTMWNRVKLRYFDWPIPVFITFIEISRIYRNIYEVK